MREGSVGFLGIRVKAPPLLLLLLLLIVLVIDRQIRSRIMSKSGGQSDDATSTDIFR